MGQQLSWTTQRFWTFGVSPEGYPGFEVID
jgi:hypothetical protein